MKATGIVRRIDDMGRICIPKEIRRQIFGTQNTEGTPMEIFMDGDSVVLKKFEESVPDAEQEIRNKAIDEFISELYKIGEHREFDWEDIYKLADQLKGGAE